MNTFANRLKELRAEKGLSAKALGDAIQASDTAIIRWENSQRGITNEYLVRLAKFFEVTTDYLLGLTDY